MYTGVQKVRTKSKKLAYQLNEEAERTERPIRRLSKVMYGSMRRYAAVKNHTELLPQREMANNQSVKRHVDAFTRGRIIGKLEEGRSITSVAAEFGIAHSIVSRLWRQFQTTGTAIRGFSSGRPRGTTHPQMTGTLSYRPEETGGRQWEKSLDTRHRRLDDRYRVLPWPEDCTVVVCLHGALPSHLRRSSVNGTRYCNEILLPYVRLFRGAMGLQFLFMADNAPCHRTVAAEQLLESEDIERMDWPA
ncbi:transposable element Tc1 transposase [Trichonephila clavipes]|nr:transposable element Tc1 transposase [Trichonephila clavipes]